MTKTKEPKYMVNGTPVFTQVEGSALLNVSQAGFIYYLNSPAHPGVYRIQPSLATSAPRKSKPIKPLKEVPEKEISDAILEAVKNGYRPNTTSPYLYWYLEEIYVSLIHLGQKLGICQSLAQIKATDPANSEIFLVNNPTYVPRGKPKYAVEGRFYENIAQVCHHEAVHRCTADYRFRSTRIKDWIKL